MLDPIAEAKRHLAKRGSRAQLDGLRRQIQNVYAVPIEDASPGLQAGLFAVGVVLCVQQSLAGLGVFRRAVKLVEKTHRDVDPSYPPMSPVTESFFDVWSAFGVELDASGTRWADVADGLADMLGVRDDVRGVLTSMCKDPCVLTLTVVDKVDGEVISGHELGTGDARTLHCEIELPVSRGSTLLAYNVADAQGRRHTVTTPYVLSPTQRMAWSDYLGRVLPGAEAARIEAYHSLLRRGPSRLGWIEYVFEAYAGHTDITVELRGVPDQPLSRPHSRQSEADADARREADHAAERERPSTAKPLMELRDSFWRTPEFSEALDGLTELFAESTGAEHVDLQELGEDIRTFLAALALYGASPGGARVIDTMRLPGHLRSEAHEEALARMRAAEPVLLEVQDVELDLRIRVKDLVTARAHWVYEKLASRGLKRFDILLAFVIPGQGQRKEFEGAMAMVPPGLTADLKDSIREVLRLAGKSRSAARPVALTLAFTQALALLHTARMRTAMPQLRNTDGHELVQAITRYRVTDRAAVLAALSKAEHVVDGGAGEEEDGVRYFDLMSADERVELQGPALLAHLEVSANQLIGRCNSRERLQSLRSLLDRLAPGACAHVADTYEDFDLAAMATGASTQQREPKELPPELARVTAEMTQRYLFQWLDMQIPALGNLTPRQAVALGGQPKKAVIQMLKSQERNWERGGTGVPVDFPGAWRELGLRHPVAAE